MYTCRATFLQHETSRVGKVNTESLAQPGVMRAYDGMYLLLLHSCSNFVCKYRNGFFCFSVYLLYSCFALIFWIQIWFLYLCLFFFISILIENIFFTVNRRRKAIYTKWNAIRAIWCICWASKSCSSAANGEFNSIIFLYIKYISIKSVDGKKEKDNKYEF